VFAQLVGSTADADVPHVISTSYGEPEESVSLDCTVQPHLHARARAHARTRSCACTHEHTRTHARTHAQVSLDYANRLNVEFQKAGARGISLLFASGDSGTVRMHPNHHPGMLYREYPRVVPVTAPIRRSSMAGAAGVGSSCSGGRFVGQWPAGSPWVTAVGGTGAQSHTAMLSRAPSASTSACFVCLLACALTVASALPAVHCSGRKPRGCGGALVRRLLRPVGAGTLRCHPGLPCCMLHLAADVVVALPTDRPVQCCGAVGTVERFEPAHSLTQALMGGGGTRQCAVLSDA
jgi:hypothetical protein